MAPFDPYHKWLGIPPDQQPVSHYRLLGIEDFEPSIPSSLRSRPSNVRPRPRLHRSASRYDATWQFTHRTGSFGFRVAKTYNLSP